MFSKGCFHCYLVCSYGHRIFSVSAHLLTTVRTFYSCSRLRFGSYNEWFCIIGRIQILLVLAEGILGYLSATLFTQKYSKLFSPKEYSKITSDVLSQNMKEKLEVHLVCYSEWRTAVSQMYAPMLTTSSSWETTLLLPTGENIFA